MDFSDRNRKVAISRWEKIHSKITLNNFFSKEKAAISAYLCGDGSICIRQEKHIYEIRFAIDDLILAKRIVNLFEREFNVSPIIKKIKSKTATGPGYFNVRISSKPVGKHLLQIGSYGGLDWNIPLKLDTESKKEWIRCFFDCEAYVNLLKKQIQVKSINQVGLNNLKELLEEQQIFPKFYGPYKQKGENHNPYYFLIIYGKDNIRKYCEKIGFYHSKKINNLHKLAELAYL